MARVFVLRFRMVGASTQNELKFGALPVRIGRNALNDCPIPVGSVSDFHARIEDVEGKICIRDLNSTNGVFFRNQQRIAPHVSVDLAPQQFEFWLGPFVQAQLEVVEGAAAQVRQRGMAMSVLGNQRMLNSELGDGPPTPASMPLAMPLAMPGIGAMDSPQSRTEPAPSLPSPQAGAANLSALPPLPGGGMQSISYGAPGGAAADPSRLPALPSAGGAWPGGRLPSLPGVAPGVGPTAPMPAYGPGPQAPRQTADFAMSKEVLAFVGLKELAMSLVPGVPFDTTGDIARLITKLNDAIEVFCRCYIPLRDGYTQFVSSMDLQRARQQRTMNRSRSFMRVEMAPNPGALAAAMLDFRDPGQDAAQAIEGVFADLMLHQLGLLEGVMRGVRALLDEISPDAIEKAAEEAGHGGALNFGKWKALWQMYRERYEELAEEKEAFSRIFGPEFTQSYREYQRRRTGTPGNR